MPAGPSQIFSQPQGHTYQLGKFTVHDSVQIKEFQSHDWKMMFVRHLQCSVVLVTAHKDQVSWTSQKQ